MIDDHGSPSWPEALLPVWPGRFRHAELVRRLHGDETLADLARCLLEGIAADRTVDQVLEQFVHEGEFRLAETLLAESDAVSAQVRKRFGDLESWRAQRLNELTAQLRTLTAAAAAADVPFEVDATNLEEMSRVSWPAVSTILDEHHEHISRQIDSLGRDLTARNNSGGTAPRLRGAVDSLIAAGRLTIAQRVLENGTDYLLVPEAQPALPTWRWSEPASEVLSWHVDPVRRRPPEFSAWRAMDSTAQDLVEAAEALGGGGPEAAADFAGALEKFLIEDTPAPVVHEFAHGWLSSVSLFQEKPLTAFSATASVNLLMLPPGVQTAPPLPGVDNYVAVGPDLGAGGGFRTGAAALTMVDLLRLVTLPSTARAIGLAKIVCRQWPLSALGAGNPADLTRLLTEDPQRQWHLLSWLCTLSGVGGSATAEDLQFQAGDDGPVLYTLLMNLVDDVTAKKGTAVPIGGSPFLERNLVGVENVVLRDCPAPGSRAAFWAALVAAPPGDALTLDSLVVAAVLSPAGEEAEWERILVDAFDQLRAQWFVADSDENAVTLRPLGVLAGLRRLAERRLVECARELSASLLDEPGEQPTTPQAWSAHRYALSKDWPVYTTVAQTDVEPAHRMDLNAEPHELIATAAELSGFSDLAEIAYELAAIARRSFPVAEFVLEIPEGVLVAVPERVLITLLYVLLDNALDATERAGKIFLSARTVEADVLIDVFDDGPGLDSAVKRTAQVFRRGFSTRGENRGTGLHLARRITEAVEGELEVADRSGGHPIFKGAHFTLILPARS
ncbi:ATP-binding protein [Nocardia gamkensis]|uniref:histidine kinase n=1 Tax=Nocardia gamkensis TaxID=352869 RepID=A0A7X6L662_9NOCA|nr:ATP-binding protein [Nocardia gamkensis]NKY28546.1 ATP-binding protein [Nocardia gamkensis]NQE69065.1 Histidine kinase [Nocardia gamkensis]